MWQKRNNFLVYCHRPTKRFPLKTTLHLKNHWQAPSLVYGFLLIAQVLFHSWLFGVFPKIQGSFPHKISNYSLPLRIAYSLLPDSLTPILTIIGATHIGGSIHHEDFYHVPNAPVFHFLYQK